MTKVGNDWQRNTCQKDTLYFRKIFAQGVVFSSYPVRAFTKVDRNRNSWMLIVQNAQMSSDIYVKKEVNSLINGMLT